MFFTVFILLAFLGVLAFTLGGARLPQTRAFGPWKPQFRPSFVALKGFGTTDSVNGAYVVDDRDIPQLEQISTEGRRAASTSTQRTRFTNEEIPRTTTWAVLTHPDLYAPVEQYREILQRDITAGLRQFAHERGRGHGVQFHIEQVIGDPDLPFGYVRFVPHPEGKARLSAIRDAQRAAEEVRQHNQSRGAIGEPHLVREHGDGSDRIELARGYETAIGRHPDNAQGQLLVGCVSRFHASILVEEGGHTWVTDIGSTQGTYINSARLEIDTPTPLPHGATLQFGRDSTYRYDAGAIGLVDTPE